MIYLRRENYETRENSKRTVLTHMYNTREKLALERFAWADMQKGFRHRPFADADLIVPSLNARWRFLPRGRARVNAISAYCLSCARERTSVLAKTRMFAPPYEIGLARDYIVTAVERTHTRRESRLSIISAG